MLAATTGKTDLANTRTISIIDQRLKREFLADSGAYESVFPATEEDRQKSQTPLLLGPNGGSHLVPNLNFGGQRMYSQEFWVADMY